MRLIDADVLIEAINKSTCNWAEHLWKRVVCDVIGNQPTAFDVKKVVAELEKQDDDCGCGKIDAWKAIDIVKMGGADLGYNPYQE